MREGDVDLDRLTKEQAFQWLEVVRRQVEESGLPFEHKVAGIYDLIEEFNEETTSQARATLMDMTFEISMLRFLVADTKKRLTETQADMNTIVSAQIDYLDPDSS